VRLLIVEDDDRTGSYLARGLTESGHIVDRAADGETGLALASEGIYDALIVDRRLPILDGLSLIRRLRETDRLTPILVLSAIGSSADRVEGMRAGCDDYLAKPYAFAEVLARLEALGAADRPGSAVDGAAGWRPCAGYAGAAGIAGRTGYPAAASGITAAGGADAPCRRGGDPIDAAGDGVEL